jgi:hypothetical protein
VSQSAVRPSRRAFVLGGGLALVLGAGAGGLAEVLRRAAPVAGTPEAQPALVAAVTAEQDLVAALDAAMTAQPSLRPVLTPIRANHMAHEQALRSVLPQQASPSPRTSPPVSPSPQTSRQALRAIESAASRTAAARALQLRGAPAALLASIAACEATHAELLS